MSHTHDDAPVEHDPTGMRALLAGLPDPGPMPADLVARITAALEAEASSPGLHVVPDVPDLPSDEASRADADDAHAAEVVPLRRPGRWRHLGVAAAVVGAVGFGGLALQVTQGGLTAAFDASSGDSGGSYAEAQSGSKDNAAGGSAPLAAPEAGSARVVVVLGDRSYRSSDLASEAARLTAGGEELHDLAAESPTIGPIGTAIGARACADALGISPTAGLLVDLATVDDRPAAVLVVVEETGRSVWAVDRSCTTGNTGLISGPVPLP